MLAVYTGLLGNLTEGVSDDNSGGNGTSLVRFTGSAGTTYYFAADGCDGADVTYSFSGGAWTPSEPTLSMGESFRSYKNVGFAWYRNYLAWP